MRSTDEPSSGHPAPHTTHASARDTKSPDDGVIHPTGTAPTTVPDNCTVLLDEPDQPPAYSNRGSSATDVRDRISANTAARLPVQPSRSRGSGAVTRDPPRNPSGDYAVITRGIPADQRCAWLPDDPFAAAAAGLELTETTSTSAAAENPRPSYGTCGRNRLRARRQGQEATATSATCGRLSRRTQFVRCASALRSARHPRGRPTP
jgi:hypothetical protein